MDINSAVGRQEGWTDDQLAAIRQGREDATFSEEERLLLRYADQMSASPVEVEDSLFARLRERFSDEQIIELTAAIAFENLRARFNRALHIESDELFCPLPGTKPQQAAD